MMDNLSARGEIRSSSYAHPQWLSNDASAVCEIRWHALDLYGQEERTDVLDVQPSVEKTTRGTMKQ